MLRSPLLLLTCLTALVVPVAFSWAMTQTPGEQEPGEDSEAPQDDVPKQGSVLILGSMDSFEAGMLEALGDAGGASPSVVILPQASEKPEAALVAKAAFEKIGVSAVQVIEDLGGASTEVLLNNADVIWFSDGSPVRLMKSLAEASITSKFHRLRSKGTLLGASGHAAGVFGMAFVEGHVSEPQMIHLSVKPFRGMGLWQGALVPDMLSENRLAHGISVCLDQPRRIALCVGPGASVRLNNDHLYFFGNGPTILLDARKAEKNWIDEKTVHSVQGATLHAFAPGEIYNWFE